MISLQAVTKAYPGSTKVLDQVHLELNPGDFLYIAGGSGVGKTSLLKLMATEEMPSSGALSLFGVNLNQASNQSLKTIRMHLGYVPQDIRLIPDLTVLDNLLLAMQFSRSSVKGKNQKQKVFDYLEKVGLAQKASEKCKNLSGGEAQKIAVIRALVREPDLIVADEPTGAQDRESTWMLMDLLMKANQQGTTVIVATHDREMIRRIRKPCAVLKSSRLLFEEGACTF